MDSPRTARDLCLVARIDLAKGRWTDGFVRTYVSQARAECVVQTVDPAARKLHLRPERRTAGRA